MSNCKNQSRACLEKHFEDFCIKLNWRVGIINEFNFAEQSVENELHYNGADESSQFLCLMLLVLALAGSCDCAGGAAVWRVWGQPAGQASDNSPPPTFPPHQPAPPPPAVIYLLNLTVKIPFSLPTMEKHFYSELEIANITRTQRGTDRYWEQPDGG